MKILTGVGSRMRSGKKSLPINIYNMMRKISFIGTSKGWIMRTGNADGADEAFRLGAYSYHEITPIELAAKFHPTWNRMSDFAKKLHGRNAYQVLGKSLDNPSDCLICWTPDGCKRHKDRSIKTGGTGTAISIADHYGIKIFNLYNNNYKSKIESWINKFPIITDCDNNVHYFDNIYKDDTYVYTKCDYCDKIIKRKYPL